MVIKEVTKRDIDNIKHAAPKDYKTLLVAAHVYTENENERNPSEIIRKSMITIITDILDKHHVKYVNDLI